MFFWIYLLIESVAYIRLWEDNCDKAPAWYHNDGYFTQKYAL